MQSIAEGRYQAEPGNEEMLLTRGAEPNLRSSFCRSTWTDKPDFSGITRPVFLSTLISTFGRATLLPSPRYTGVFVQSRALPCVNGASSETSFHINSLHHRHALSYGKSAAAVSFSCCFKCARKSSRLFHFSAGWHARPESH